MRARAINDIIRGMEELGLRMGDRVLWRGHELMFTHLGWYTGHAYFERVGFDQEVCIPTPELGKIRRVQ